MWSGVISDINRSRSSPSANLKVYVSVLIRYINVSAKLLKCGVYNVIERVQTDSRDK